MQDEDGAQRKPRSAVRFHWKEAKVYFGSGTISICSVDGGVHASVVLYEHLKKYAEWRCKLSVLIWDRIGRQFYISVAVENRIPIEPVRGNVLGIDRGLNNVAVFSNNMFFDSSRINATRGRYAKNRQEAAGDRHSLGDQAVAEAVRARETVHDLLEPSYLEDNREHGICGVRPVGSGRHR